MRLGPAIPGHERFRRLALAGGNLVHAAAGSDRAILVKDTFAVSVARIFVAMLDQQPVGAFSPAAVVSHPHQHPASMQLVAMQGELQIALLESLFRIVGFPITAVPE